MLAVAGRDRDVALVDQRQVALGGAEHVEVVAKPGPGVELPQDRGDPPRHALGAARLSLDIVRASSHSRTKTSQSGSVWTTRGATPASAAATRVVELVAAIDREQLRAGAGDPHEAGRAVHLDPVVRVGQPGRDPLGGHGPPRPIGDRGDDLLDRRWHRTAAPERVVAAATLSMVEHARAVIIGGGVGGTSIAYHLAERGWTDIVLVDRAELTSGSTFHSAGLVGQLRSSVTLTKMMMYGTDAVPAPGRRDRAPTRRGTRSARCGWRRARNASRSCAARPAGPRRSASRSS